MRLEPLRLFVKLEQGLKPEVFRVAFGTTEVVP
jgi:hypothetical protein